MPAVDDVVVVNTGPLIALTACGQLELLPRLHARVLVPDAVFNELVRGRTGEPSITVPRAAWLEVTALQRPVDLLRLKQLDPGEGAVITLALDRSIPLVVIDERRGRMVARSVGLQVTGSVGVLVRAKNLGLLPAIRPCLDAMVHAGIWLSPRVIERAFRETGE